MKASRRLLKTRFAANSPAFKTHKLSMLSVALMVASIMPASAAITAEPGAPSPGNPATASVPGIITLQPTYKGLISVDEQMDPFNLDAAARQELSLQQALQAAVNQNLDIGIAHTHEMQQSWHYRAALGRFLPDLTAGYTLYGLSGTIQLPFAAGPGGGTTKAKLPSHFNLLQAGFTYNAYQGGRIVFGALQNMHLLRAQRAQTHFTLSDTLMQVTRTYYNLLLAEALLEVRIRAVDTSMEQLRINTELANNGLATNLDVLQSQTQLSRDRQELITQQIARRSAAIQLATILNANPSSDIIPTDRTLRKVRLISPALKVQDLLQLAIANRAELKQNEELRLAARNAIVVAAAPLQPTVRLAGNAYGLGQNIGHLGSFATLALNANWMLHGLGVTDASETEAARWQARERLLAANRELSQVISQVRNSLLHSLQAEQQIEETSNEVASAQEELRLAKLRFEHGLGANIDVITAQRDLTNALVNRAQAMMDFNIAQAQLLHDVGLISVSNLTAGTVIQKS